MIERTDGLVLAEVTEHVCTVRLNNPERRNAWSAEMEEKYYEVLDLADRNGDVRVIVLTGVGRSFCPGMDTQRLTAASQSGVMAIDRRRPQTYPLRIRKPMIAAINGACAGIGLMQAVNCDIRFASTTAKFTTAYSRRGLPAEYGSSWLLPKLIGVEAALDILISGRVFDAQEAQRIGLVSRVVEADSLVEEVTAYARDLAVNCSPRSMAAIRRQVYGDLSRGLEESMTHTLAVMRDFAGQPDFAEGVASFVEKRPPHFAPLDSGYKVAGDHDYH